MISALVMPCRASASAIAESSPSITSPKGMPRAV